MQASWLFTSCARFNQYIGLSVVRICAAHYCLDLQVWHYFLIEVSHSVCAMLQDESTIGIDLLVFLQLTPLGTKDNPSCFFFSRSRSQKLNVFDASSLSKVWKPILTMNRFCRMIISFIKEHIYFFTEMMVSGSAIFQMCKDRYLLFN